MGKEINQKELEEMKQEILNELKDDIAGTSFVLDDAKLGIKLEFISRKKNIQELSDLSLKVLKQTLNLRQINKPTGVY